MICYLLGRDNKGKLRFYQIESDEEWHLDPKGFIIKRSYGTVGGKVSESPDIVVRKKPASRKWADQLALKFESEKKKQLDKGYIELPNPIDTYTYKELDKIFGDVKTDQSGVIKPQLAKPSEKVTDKSIFDKEWMISSKLDGTKALFYYKDGEVHTASRGGSSYDVSTRHLRFNPNLIKFFEANPTVVLDGELFKCATADNEYPLQLISGAVRTEDPNVDTSWIEYWVYDCYVNSKMTAIDRQQFLIDEFAKVDIPLYDGGEDTYPIMLLEQHTVSGYDNMLKYHDFWVSKGFEGAVIKDPTKPYKPGSRCNNLIKIKMRKEETYQVIGYELGVRGAEDMVFVCELPDGRLFRASPMGDRKMKEEYVQNFDTVYKDQMADVTYFTLSSSGTPTQPFVKCFRFDLD